jgi:hypothetical protein
MMNKIVDLKTLRIIRGARELYNRLYVKKGSPQFIYYDKFYILELKEKSWKEDKTENQNNPLQATLLYISSKLLWLFTIK